MNQYYASADWHGCGILGKKILKYLDDSDILFFLGDAIDRGPDGIELFNLLISRPNTIYIKGNHEAMMAESIPYIWEEIEDINIYNGDKYRHWYQNGGDKTAKAFWSMTKKEIFEIKNKIDKMPTEMSYHTLKGNHIILEHAGYTPWDIPRRSHDPLWDREHFYDCWYDTSDYKNFYVIHGHTPVQYMRYSFGYTGKEPLTKEEILAKRKFFDGVTEEDRNYKPTILKYCNGHKINIDLCSIYSRRAVLLNLETFEEIYFDE